MSHNSVVFSSSPALTEERLVERPTGVLFMDRNEWFTAVFLSTIAAIAALPFSDATAGWLPIAVGLSTFVLIHAGLGSRFCIPFPQIALLVALIQLILAPVVTYHFPLHHPAYDIGERLPIYLGFAGPAVLCLMAGLYLPQFTARHAREWRGAEELGGHREAVARELDKLMYVGVGLTLISPPLPGSLQFVSVLLMQLAFAGLLGRVLLGYTDWGWRAVLVLGVHVASVLEAAVFHLLLLWAAYFVLVLSFRHRWGRKAAAIVLAGFLAACALQQIKTTYRTNVRANWSRTLFAKASLFAESTVSILGEPKQLVHDQNVAETAMRLNQGWIINLVMQRVPDIVPPSGGDMLWRQIVATLVPRVLMPGKYRVGGKEYFERYTGHKLFGASMGMGYAGEMYANFGYLGGLFGVFCYGLVLGIGFRICYEMAQYSSLWWMWGAFIAVVGLKAEDSVGFVLNWGVKAAVLVPMILYFTPAIRRELFPPGSPLSLRK